MASYNTVRRKILAGENIDEFDEFPAIRQYFPDQDDDKMNTLAFVNFLLIKLFPTLIRQNFAPSKICAVR